MNTETPHTSDIETKEKMSGAGFLTEILKIVLISMAIVIPIRIFIAQPYIVSGSSMDPTFKDKDYIIVDQLSYRLHEPERQDVIIFRYPKDPSQFFIKRVIGLPGETVTINGGVVTIKDTADDTLLLEEPYIVHEKIDSTSLTLGEEEYFVMGDNRRSSLDSRIWGPLPRNLIIGEAFVRLLPSANLGLYPGSTENFSE